MSLKVQDIIAREVRLAVDANMRQILDSLQKGDLSAFQKPQLPELQSPSSVRRDARDRSKRTFIQLLLVDLMIAVATAIAQPLLSLDITSKDQWIFLGILAAKTTISTLVSYVFRIFYAPEPEKEVERANIHLLSLAESRRLEP